MEHSDLPHDLEALRELALSLQSKLSEQEARLDEQSSELQLLREYVRLLKQKRFGRSSEKASDDQGCLFDEAEFSAERDPEPEPEPDTEICVSSPTRQKRGRRPLPAWIPRVDVVHDLPESQKRCSYDGTALERMGEESSEQLEFIPAQLRVLRHVRPKYACPTCRTGVVIAPMPRLPIPKSIASPTLLAHVAVSKYADGLPLYRQEAMFRRVGIDLMRTSLANWMIQIGQQVQPLINLLREDLLSSGFVQCDETVLQVLKEPGRRAESQSYMWVQYSPAETIVLFEYDPSRGAHVPERLFEGFKGILQTDGYKAYDSLGAEDGVTHIGCWGHARRKFDEALKSQRSSKKRARSTKESKALQGFSFIQKLYKIEQRIGDRRPDERLKLRQEFSKPVIEKLRVWLGDAIPRVPPKSLTGIALTYLHHQWPKLIRVLDDGRVPLDTNGVENAIRPFVIGRKGWLFADTVRGAEASANLYSLIETAKHSGLEPFAYLRHILEHLPRAVSLADFEALLPANIDPKDLPRPDSFARVKNVVV